jgi:ribosomal protein L28
MAQDDEVGVVRNAGISPLRCASVEMTGFGDSARQEQTQIPCGNDKQKGKDKSKRRFPSGMTSKRQRQGQTQIPFGNDKQKGKDKSKRRFPSGMTSKRRRPPAQAKG